MNAHVYKCTPTSISKENKEIHRKSNEVISNHYNCKLIVTESRNESFKNEKSYYCNWWCRVCWNKFNKFTFAQN